MSSNERARLDSWKEIAEYLGRDVHTCLRWEKEKGLPVHTIPGGKRRTVYAYKHEIDEWLAKSLVSDEIAEKPAPALGWQVPLKNFWQRMPVVARAVLVFLILGFAGLGAYLVAESRSPALTTMLQEGNRLVAISPNSSVAWTYEFPSEKVKILNSIVLPSAGVKDEAGVLVTVSLGEGKGDALYFFSPRGQPLWQFQSVDRFIFGSSDYPLSWGFNLLGVIRLGNHSKVLLATRHYSWWPAQLLLLDLQGNIESRFFNAGWISQGYLMDGADGPVLVVSGVSNSFDGAFLALLNPGEISGTSPEAAGSPYSCKNCPAGRPRKYFVFPRSELNLVTGSPLYEAGGHPQGDIIPVIKWELPSDLGQAPPEAVYEFSRDFHLIRSRYGERYWEWHHKLEKEGKIKHSRDQCPERNGPPRIHQWDAQNGWQEIHPNQP
ncbi:MAG: hypothetical protein M1453_14030 [Acidobacteria bacterium]|nr:hypothetical protein [Acidobacteriota bacterium]